MMLYQVLGYNLAQKYINLFPLPRAILEESLKLLWLEEPYMERSSQRA